MWCDGISISKTIKYDIKRKGKKIMNKNTQEKKMKKQIFVSDEIPKQKQ